MPASHRSPIAGTRRCAAILSELEAANREASANDPIPRGLLRVTAPMLLGYAFVARVMAEFQQHYPQVWSEDIGGR